MLTASPCCLYTLFKQRRGLTQYNEDSEGDSQDTFTVVIVCLPNTVYVFKVKNILRNQRATPWKTTFPMSLTHLRSF